MTSTQTTDESSNEYSLVLSSLEELKPTQAVATMLDVDKGEFNNTRTLTEECSRIIIEENDRLEKLIHNKTGKSSRELIASFSGDKLLAFKAFLQVKEQEHEINELQHQLTDYICQSPSYHYQLSRFRG